MVKNASAFRLEIQHTLKPIFKSLHSCYQAYKDNIKGKNMRESVLKMLETWQSWAIFPSTLVPELKAIFLPEEDPTQQQLQEAKLAVKIALMEQKLAVQP